MGEEESTGTHNRPENNNSLLKIASIVDAPVTFFREKIVEPLRSKNKQPYYHRRFPRVPTADECEVDDYVCLFEATDQMYRDRHVDKQIIQIIQNQLRDCIIKEGQYDATFKCKELDRDLSIALTNYHVKYGDLAANANALDVYMKQKHRLIWQRRNPNKDLFGYNKIDEVQKNREELTKTAFDKDRNGF